jgi:transcriptional regulator of nitric oxide reductase
VSRPPECSDRRTRAQRPWRRDLYLKDQTNGCPRIVFKTLHDTQDWARVSKLAHTTGLPVEEVRRALRTLAMTGRASRAIRPMDERFIELWTAAKPRERT